MVVRVRQIEGLPEDLDALLRESLAEDFHAIAKLRDAWIDSGNRFDLPGEALFEARARSELVGVCGLNADPYLPASGVGRVRHLYVLPEARRQGVASALVGAVVERASKHFHTVRLRTPSSDGAAAAFYEALGFFRTAGEDACTHKLSLLSRG
ncbi:MAG: GNAT family N-acetyltransferase [Myxococcales bacterium]|jgi:GNAT superfamily N-acetyltransferase